MMDHVEYERLCALAVTEQLTASERESFDEHLLDCRGCRERITDLRSVGMHLQYAAASHPNATSLPAGAVERFRARAVQEGLVVRVNPERRFTSYALASLAGFFFVLSSLFVTSHRRDGANRVAATPAVEVPVQERVDILESGAKPSRPTIKVAHASLVRHEAVRRVEMAADDTSDASLRFLRAMPPHYPFFGPQNATNSARNRYPTLSGSQIAKLNLFRDLYDDQSGGVGRTTARGQPVNIASAGNSFDFSADIRQLHFQIPTAQ